MKSISFCLGLALLFTLEADFEFTSLLSSLLIYGAAVCGAAHFLSGEMRAGGEQA